MQLELGALDRAAQSLFGRESRGGGFQQFRAEHPHAAAALRLRVEERRIGRPEQAFRVAPVVREHACTEAEAHEQLAAFDDERFLETAHDPVRGELDFLGPARLFEDHDELVAAQPRAVAEVAHGRAQAIRHCLQHAVSEHVAHAVVDGLEIVEVEEVHAGEQAALGRARERLVKLDEELAAVRQARQGIVGGEVLQLARPLLDLCFELAVILPRKLLRGRQAFRHLVE